MDEGSLRIAVASHKPYWMPHDPAYVPVWAGAATQDAAPPSGWGRDDAGDDSISDKNQTFCELTVLWWAWHHVECDYLGLAHYRRHFSRGPFGKRASRVARGDDLLRRLERVPVILPRERHYHIETSYSQYVHAHHKQDLSITRAILAERHPSYLAAYDASMARTHGHRFNMLVMRRDLLDAYCTWLFGVLFELERRLDISAYSANDRRVFGFVAERLLDPWLEATGVPYVEMAVVNLESQHWPRKGAAFLARKLRGRRG